MLLKFYADGGYQGLQLKGALLDLTRQVAIEVVMQSDTAKGFHHYTSAVDI